MVAFSQIKSISHDFYSRLTSDCKKSKIVDVTFHKEYAYSFLKIISIIIMDLSFHEWTFLYRRYTVKLGLVNFHVHFEPAIAPQKYTKSPLLT